MARHFLHRLDQEDLNVAKIKRPFAVQTQMMNSAVQLADIVQSRSEQGRDYGVVLLPEGLIEFVPEMGRLISEINDILAQAPADPLQALSAQLTPTSRQVCSSGDCTYLGLNHQMMQMSWTLPTRKNVGLGLKGSGDTLPSGTLFLRKHSLYGRWWELGWGSGLKQLVQVFELLPAGFRQQLLLDRDPHGNVQVAKIETERLLLELVTVELARRKQAGIFKGKFNSMTHYMGYEGRASLPTNFDAT